MSMFANPKVWFAGGLAALTLVLHAVDGIHSYMTRSAASPPMPAQPPPFPSKAAPPAVAAVAPAPAPPVQRHVPAPPHRTREDLVALLRYLKSGGELSDSQRRELWNAGLRIRMARGDLSTLEIVAPPGYLPPAPQPAPLAPVRPPQAQPHVNTEAQIAEIRRQLALDFKREFDRQTGRPFGTTESAQRRLDEWNAAYAKYTATGDAAALDRARDRLRQGLHAPPR